SQAAGGPHAVYLYPGVGAGSIVAAQGDPAPSGGVFRRFKTPSINDTGDIAFFGDLVVGDGVYVRPFAGVLVKAAATSDTSPGGGVFDKFPSLSRINASGALTFLSTVSGGPSGIFKYSGGIVTKVAVVGDSTGTGRQFCSFATAEIG